MVRTQCRKFMMDVIDDWSLYSITERALGAQQWWRGPRRSGKRRSKGCRWSGKVMSGSAI